MGKRYNKPEVMIIEGNFDIAQFKSIFKKLADRHEILRTSFELVDGAIMQKVHENINFDIGYMESKEIILEDITYEFMQPYDLNKVPLFKVKVVKLAPEKHAILLDMHQIITDGISSNILVQEMIDLYVGKTLQELTIQYKDFVVWQNEFSKSEYMKKQEDYWLSIFSSESHVLNLPTDYPRPSIKSFEGDRIEFQLDEELADGLNRLALDTDTTMYMILLAAYNVLLLKCTGQEDIVVGSQIAGRRRLEQENMIGMFANALAMRNFPERDKTFIEFLKQVQNNALSAYENQDYQYEELVDKLQLHKDLSRNALFDTMFGLFNADSRFLQYDSLKLVRHDFVNCVAKYDTALLAFEVDGNIKFDLRYCVKLFKKETVTLFAEHFLCILRDVVKNPLRSLGDMGFLP